MGVSYRGERMIGNMPFSLFNGQKGRAKYIYIYINRIYYYCYYNIDNNNNNIYLPKKRKEKF